VFDLLDIPGVGPKTALELAKLGVKSLESLNRLQSKGELVKRGLSQKMADRIPMGVQELSGCTDRMLLPLNMRTKEIEKFGKMNIKSIRVLNGLEIDILPDGTLSVSNSILKTLDYCIPGVHSGDRGSSEDITAKNNKIMEMNAFPNRLDLRDDLARLALSFGCKFVIDTDAHEVSQMENMEYGISVARRGWVESKDVINAWDWKKFAKWFNIDL